MQTYNYYTLTQAARANKNNPMMKSFAFMPAKIKRKSYSEKPVNRKAYIFITFRLQRCPFCSTTM